MSRLADAYANAVRELVGEAGEFVARRSAEIPKSQRNYDRVLAVDPLKVVMAQYGDEAAEFLARAKAKQVDDPIQFLDDARYRTNDYYGVSGHEIPLYYYDRPGVGRGAEGRFRLDSRGRSAIQVGNNPLALVEESRHALDRLYGKGVARRLQAPANSPPLWADMSPRKAEQYMEYLSLPEEIRATLGGLLPGAGPINTAEDAARLLEKAREAGNLRERITAEGVLNSRSLRNEAIPYLRRALIGAGVAAGNNYQGDNR